jgi:hypothetical protein
LFSAGKLLALSESEQRVLSDALLETGANAFEVLEHAGRLAKTAKRWRNTALAQTGAANRQGA